MSIQNCDSIVVAIRIGYGVTTVINTHDMNSVMEIGQNIIFLHQGAKHWEGNNKDILTNENDELNSFIFASNFLKEAKESMLKKQQRAAAQTV